MKNVPMENTEHSPSGLLAGTAGTDPVAAAGSDEHLSLRKEPSRVHRDILDAMAPPGVLVDAQLQVVHIAEAARVYLRPVNGALVGELEQLIRGELRDEVSQALRRAFEYGDTILCQPVRIDFGAATRRVCMQVRPVAASDRHGKLALVLFIDAGAGDGTRHELAQEQQAHSQHLLKVATENSGVGLALVDRDRRYVFANRAYSKMLTGNGDLVGKRVQDFVDPSRLEAALRRLDQAFAGERLAYEEEQVDPNGKRGVFSISLEPEPHSRLGVGFVAVAVYDLTQARLATQRIEENEERLRLANEAAGIGTFAINAKTGLAYYSPELTTMLGIPGANVVSLSQAFSRVHRDDLARVRELYRAAQNSQGDGYLRMDFRFVRPGGEVRWLTWNGRIHFTDGPNGREADRVVGVCVDITERRKAEADLVRSEARYRSVVEGSLQGIILQQNEKIVYANPAMARIFGYDRPEEMIGKSTFDDFIMENERPLLRARTAAAFRGELLAPHPGWRGFKRDGTEIWISAMAHLAEWQGKPAVVSFYLDVTERKRNEQRLNETLRLMKVACTAGRMGTWHFDATSHRLNYSDEGLELLGLDKAKWTGAVDSVEAVVHPHDILKRRRVIADAIANRKDVDLEFRVLRPDGSVRWMLVRGHVLTNPRGTYDGLGVILDITERKAAEERQQILIRELDHRVKNSLESMQLVMERSRGQSTSIDEFRSALESRLMSMANTHSRLSKAGWTGVGLGDIIGDALKPYCDDRNMQLDGPKIVLKPSASQAVAMAVFELAMNASKYGALKNPQGQVRVCWRLEAKVPGQPRSLVIEWEEAGGRVISLPVKPGYGTSVIRELVPYELKGSTSAFEVRESGAYCRLEIPNRFVLLN